MINLEPLMVIPQITLILMIGFSSFLATSQTDKNYTITCTGNGCKGTYNGPEFTNGADVAHQFSNHMSNKVGKQLKALYDKGIYVQVNLANIKMTTKNMDNRGNVIYSLDIPFVKVNTACDAFTAFDHRGGWGHQIKKESVVTHFKNQDNLKMIELTTSEGLQEFWIQWRHKTKQAHCK